MRLWRQCRTTETRRTELPLDEIDVSNPVLFRNNTMWGYFARLHREEPVHYCKNSLFGPYWSVTKFQDIMQVETNSQVFSSESRYGGITIMDSNAAASLPMFIAMDPPKHDEQRKVVSPIVASENLAKLEARTESIHSRFPKYLSEGSQVQTKSTRSRSELTLAGIALALLAGLSACGSGSDPSSTTASNMLLTPAEVGCQPVSGPLDTLQGALTSGLTQVLKINQSNQNTTAVHLEDLINSALDLIDATANGAASLQTAANGGNPGLVTPILNQLLCVTATTGELLVSATKDATTPAAQVPVLNGLLSEIVSLEEGLEATLAQVSADKPVPFIAGLLSNAANTLAVILHNAATSFPGVSDISGVIAPVTELLSNLSTSLAAMQSGDVNSFANDLLGAVSTLVNGLVANLGPIGSVAQPLVYLLDGGLNLVSQILSKLLGIAL